MKASRQKIMPWKAGWIPFSPGTKTLRVFSSAFTMSSAEMSRKMPISIAPSRTPARVESATPR
jgi:hypothetical protein